MKEEKKLNLPQSLLLLVLIIFSVAVCIRLKTGGPMIGLFASWIFIYLVCKIVRIPYDNVVAGAYDAIRMVVPTLCLLMAIGVMIGTWLQSGTIATIIAWGLKMINPAWLLPLTLLFCSVLSVVTGTSYGSVGSAGVAMMAIGNAMGINSGMGSMLQYVAIISFAVGMGGMLEKLGVLEHILNAVVKRINSDGSMILVTLIVGYITSLISCSQPMSHVLTGRLMAPVFKERKVAPEILSRCLEDSGTMAGPMIPWHGYGVYMAGTLGVAWAAFFPYLFLLYLTPIFSIIYGFTGISIKHVSGEEVAE